MEDSREVFDSDDAGGPFAEWGGHCDEVAGEEGFGYVEGEVLVACCDEEGGSGAH
jgi:hypothetical protein